MSVTVTAVDPYGNTATGYSGTVRISSSDGTAGLPATKSLTSGAGTFSVTLNTPGNQTVIATDSINSSITGSGAVSVSPLAATHFVVSAPTSRVAGGVFAITVTAKDALGNTATGYTGMVHISSSSDGQATLSADATLTAGVGYFGAALRTSGNQTLTATDTTNSSLSGTSLAIAVSPAAASHFVVSAPNAAITGNPFSFTVTAKDPFNNTATGYIGTLTFTSTDSQAALPGNATLTAGTGVFSATLISPGNQTVIATNVATNVTGVSNTIISRGLTVTSLTPTSTGFVATFDKPFVASDINLYDSTSGGGVDAVVLTGPGAGRFPSTAP